MRIADGVGGALGTLRAYPLRAFFTVLGTLVGVAFLIAVVTILEGMSHYVETRLIGRFFGYNTVTLRRDAAEAAVASGAERRARSRHAALTMDDARWMAERMRTPGVLSAGWTGTAQARVPGGRALGRVVVSGTTATHFQVHGLRVAKGRPFLEREAERGLPVAVIGSEVAERLFPGGSAVGGRVLLRGIAYRVVGVLAPQETLFTLSMDRVAVVPAGSPLDGVITPRGQAEAIQFKVPHARFLPAALAEAEGLMRVRNRLRPEQENAFSLTTSEDARAAWGKVARVLMVAVPGLIAISLVVGALVIMNIMLVTVTERTYEIGLRKAVGARGRDILLQFLVESATLSGLGGALGVLAGLALAAAVAAVSPLPAQVAPWSAVLGVLVGCGVGVVAGVYPASRAARMEPIAALGHE
jgi:putative ABC transport system permease protein